MFVTNSKERSQSWESDSLSANQETLRRLWNPTVHYRVPECLPLVPILSNKNLVHALLFYFFTIHFNIILTSTLSNAFSVFQ